jgi:hypothetical protein
MTELLKPTTALSPANSGALPATLLDKTAADAGRGVSFDQSDQLLPLIYILQSNSPYTDRRSPDYIDDAEAGHFYFRNAQVPIRDGTAGITVIPVRMGKVSIEWLPDRQGLVAIHPEPPDDLQAMQGDTNRRRPRLVRASSGNVVEEARQWYLPAALRIDEKHFCEGVEHVSAAIPAPQDLRRAAGLRPQIFAHDGAAIEHPRPLVWAQVCGPGLGLGSRIQPRTGIRRCGRSRFCTRRP